MSWLSPRSRSSTTTPEEDVSALDAPPVLISGRSDERVGSRGLGQRVPALRPLSPVPTYAGIAIAVIGFVLIMIAWGGTAGQVNVALQVPYLISAGLNGLGLIMVGVTVINVAAKRRDSLLREQQNQLLADALRELSAALEDQDGRG